MTMKKAYIQPLMYQEQMNLECYILEASTLVQQGGDKDGSWNGEVKDQVDDTFGDLW